MPAPPSSPLDVALLTQNPAGAQASVLGFVLNSFRGHTVTVIDESAFTSSIASARDVIVCIDNSDPVADSPEDVVANLETHMGTHSVPVVVMYSDLGGAGSLSTTALACRLGLVANLIEYDASGSDRARRRTGTTTTWAEGMPFTKLLRAWVSASPTNGPPSAKTLFAGTGAIERVSDSRLLALSAEAGEDRIPSVGGTFPTRIGWTGFAVSSALFSDAPDTFFPLIEYVAGGYDGLGF